MRRRAKSAVRLLLAAALLYGAGAQWLLIQGAAWAGMLAARSGRTTVARAVTTTFDGAHPCRVCLLVKRGATSGSAPRASVSSPTVDFAFFAAPAVLPAILAETTVPEALPSFASAPRVPPTPPPDVLLPA